MRVVRTITTEHIHCSYFIHNNVWNIFKIVPSAQPSKNDTRGTEEELCVLWHFSFSTYAIPDRPVVEAFFRYTSCDRDCWQPAWLCDDDRRPRTTVGKDKRVQNKLRHYTPSSLVRFKANQNIGTTLGRFPTTWTRSGQRLHKHEDHNTCFSNNDNNIVLL